MKAPSPGIDTNEDVVPVGNVQKGTARQGKTGQGVDWLW